MKTYSKGQIMARFGKLSNKNKIAILLKALEIAEAHTNIPVQTYIIDAMGFRKSAEKDKYLDINKINLEWTAKEMERILSGLN